MGSINKHMYDLQELTRKYDSILGTKTVTVIDEKRDYFMQSIKSEHHHPVVEKRKLKPGTLHSFVKLRIKRYGILIEMAQIGDKRVTQPEIDTVLDMSLLLGCLTELEEKEEKLMREKGAIPHVRRTFTRFIRPIQ